MTTGGDARQFGFLAAAAGGLDDDPVPGSDAEPVGEGDVEADRVRAGGDGDLAGATRDDDGTPVGEADRAADVERSGAAHHHRHDV